MDEKWSTAFHEAGHCVQALSLEKRSFVSARVVQIRDKWEGDSNIDLRDISDIDRVNVALAGIVAEGMGKWKEIDIAAIPTKQNIMPSIQSQNVCVFIFTVKTCLAGQFPLLLPLAKGLRQFCPAEMSSTFHLAIETLK